MPLVVFMRGVNVGTAKRFQPSLFARELEHLGVSNLGAAGTFVVRGTLAESALRAEFLRRLGRLRMRQRRLLAARPWSAERSRIS